MKKGMFVLTILNLLVFWGLGFLYPYSVISLNKKVAFHYSYADKYNNSLKSLEPFGETSDPTSKAIQDIIDFLSQDWLTTEEVVLSKKDLLTQASKLYNIGNEYVGLSQSKINYSESERKYLRTISKELGHNYDILRGISSNRFEPREVMKKKVITLHSNLIKVIYEVNLFKEEYQKSQNE